MLLHVVFLQLHRTFVLKVLISVSFMCCGFDHVCWVCILVVIFDGPSLKDWGQVVLGLSVFSCIPSMSVYKLLSKPRTS